MMLSPHVGATPRSANAITVATSQDGGDRRAGILDEDDERMRVLLGPSADGWGLQRGDFVAPDLLLIVYEEAWLETIEAVATEALLTTDVHVLVDPGVVHDPWLNDWSRSLGVRLLAMNHDTPWIRDYGPLQRMGDPGRVVWLDFDYGPDRKLDDDVPLGLMNRFDMPLQRSAFTLDGGALVSNGMGLCAMTDRSLVEAGVAVEDVDAVEALLETLGCEVMAALPDLPDEPTGHADMMVQFVAPDGVMIIMLDDSEHPEEALLVEAGVRTLTVAAANAGQPLKVHRIPAAYDKSNGTLFSYVNGTRLRDRYLAPAFSAVDPALAQRAQLALREAMPRTAIASIPSDEVLASAGVLHCITLGLSVGFAH